MKITWLMQVRDMEQNELVMKEMGCNSIIKDRVRVCFKKEILPQ